METISIYKQELEVQDRNHAQKVEAKKQRYA